MARSYLIDFYIRKLALVRVEVAALTAGGKSAEALEAEIADLEARMAEEIAKDT